METGPTPARNRFRVGGVLLAVTVMALAACWLPARRAMRVDPLAALHRE